MSPLTDLTAALLAARDLAPDEVAAAAAALADGGVPDADKEAFLEAMGTKGETVAEVAGFARAFRDRAVDPGVQRWSAEAIDIVGTGGDHAGGFNISTMVVFVLASAGVKVMKHGNRGITSKCGSADLISALGANLEASHAMLRRSLDELGFAYFFAPAYHPAFLHIGPVRKVLAARGRRTIFNILGPLINPGRPAHVLLGVFSAAWVPRLASALDALGASSGLAVHGVLGPAQGIDELTTAGVNQVQGAGRLKGVVATWRAEDFGLKPAPFSDLKGGDLDANLALVESLLAGRGPAGLVDTIALNSAVALWMTGRTASVGDGIAQARELLSGGAVRRKIEATREFFRST
jgi:anthranilate phosphoribosyltransferase